MKVMVCKRCGVSHECVGKLSDKERARKAADSRWRNPEEKLAVAKEALAKAPQPKVARTVKSLVPTPARADSVEVEKRVRPSDMCPHNREYRHCMVGLCKAAIE